MEYLCIKDERKKGPLERRVRVYLPVGIINCDRARAAPWCERGSGAPRLGLKRVCLVECI